MQTQEIIAYGLVVIAIVFLVKKLFLNKKKNCSGGTNCNCGH
nr:FeoB-associated Cys-rich membrane protein [uncultured Capnocytophaga sp.]